MKFERLLAFALGVLAACVLVLAIQFSEMTRRVRDLERSNAALAEQLTKTRLLHDDLSLFVHGDGPEIGGSR